jgi:hypothetical protein
MGNPSSALMVPAMRRLLIFAAVLVFIAGAQLFILSDQTARFFAWTVDPPLTAAFLGAAYWASGVMEWLAARERFWVHARIAVPSVLIFTLLTLVATLIHIARFHFESSDPITLAATWAWLAIYVAVPPLMLYGLARQWRASTHDLAREDPLPMAVRVFFGVFAIVLLIVGVAFFVAPEATVYIWPWTLTPLTGRAVGAWLIGLGLTSAQLTRENDALRVRPAIVSALTLAILEIVALVRYSSDVDWTRLLAWVYIIFIVGLLLASGTIAKRGLARE